MLLFYMLDIGVLKEILCNPTNEIFKISFALESNLCGKILHIIAEYLQKENDGNGRFLVRFMDAFITFSRQ